MAAEQLSREKGKVCKKRVPLEHCLCLRRQSLAENLTLASRTGGEMPVPGAAVFYTALLRATTNAELAQRYSLCIHLPAPNSQFWLEGGALSVDFAIEINFALTAR